MNLHILSLLISATANPVPVAVAQQSVGQPLPNVEVYKSHNKGYVDIGWIDVHQPLANPDWGNDISVGTLYFSTWSWLPESAKKQQILLDGPTKLFRGKPNHWHYIVHIEARRGHLWQGVELFRQAAEREHFEAHIRPWPIGAPGKPTLWH